MFSLRGPRAAYRNTPLVGDLLEQYARGRSRVWFWSQALIAISTRSWNDVASHKLLTLRALAIGWATTSLLSRLLNRLTHKNAPYPIQRWPIAFGYRHFGTNIPGFGWQVFGCVAPLAAGWIVGRLHRQYQMAMVLLFAVSLEVVFLVTLPWTYVSVRGWPS